VRRPATATTPKSTPSERRASRPARARQERGVRTEEAILQATLRLLATRGIHGMSLDLLAEEVGIAKSSILWHFGSKEELLLRVAERVLEEVARGPVREMLALPTIEERADAAWRFFEATIRERPELRRLVLWLIFECVEERPEMRTRLQQLYRSIRDMFEQGLREVVPDAAQRRRLAIITLATFDGLFIQWLLEPDAIDVEAIHSELRLRTDPARLGRRSRKDR
jgi:AcrR family transcriptional regulator